MDNGHVPADLHPHDPEHLRPQLIPRAEFITVSPAVIFLKNPENQAYLKVNGDEAEMARRFDGRQTLSDILEQCLASGGTRRFPMLFDLLIRLKNAGFLSPESGAALLSHIGAGEAQSPLAALRQRMRKWLSFTLCPIPLSFDAKICRRIAGICSSTGALIALAAIAGAGFALWPEQNGISQLLAFSLRPDAAARLLCGSFAAGIVVFWLALCGIISLKNLLSAYVMRVKGCKPVNPRIEFRYGILVFAADIDDIVAAGRRSIMQLMSARFLTPVLLLCIMLALYRWVDPAPALLLVAQACVFAALFSACPLLPSELTRTLSLALPEKIDAAHFLAFLRRRFLQEIFAFTHKERDHDLFIIMSVLSLAWLYVMYAAVWDMVRGGMIMLLAQMQESSPITQIFITAYLLFISVPLVILFAVSLMVAVSNAGSVARSPLHRLMKLSRRIGRRNLQVNEHSVAFLECIPLFSALAAEELKGLCAHMTMEKFGRNRAIIIQGEAGDAFYTIVSGAVAVIREGSDGAMHVVDELTTGDSFGEIALVENVPRTATIRTRGPVVALKLGREHFEKYIASSATGRRKISDYIRISRLIMNTGVFAHLTPHQIYDVMARLRDDWIDAGAPVFRQGDPGDRFYVIFEGKITIQRRENGAVTFEKEMGKGDYFGEIALVKNVPRTASASAAVRTRLLSLDKAAFYDLLKANMMTGVAIDDEGGRRMRQLGREVVRTCS